MVSLTAEGTLEETSPKLIPGNGFRCDRIVQSGARVRLRKVVVPQLFTFDPLRSMWPVDRGSAIK